MGVGDKSESIWTPCPIVVIKEDHNIERKYTAGPDEKHFIVPGKPEKRENLLVCQKLFWKDFIWYKLLHKDWGKKIKSQQRTFLLILWKVIEAHTFYQKSSFLSTSHVTGWLKM